MPACPFISNLSYHGINISIVGSRSARSDEPSSFVKEVIVGDSGELVIGLEDIISGKVILSIPKDHGTNLLEKVLPQAEESNRNFEESATIEVSPNDSLKRGHDEFNENDGINIPRAEVSPIGVDQSSFDPKSNENRNRTGEDITCPAEFAKKLKVPQSVKKKISLSNESLNRNSDSCLLTPSSSFSSKDCAPESRWGHTMTKISGGSLVVYGGQSEEDHNGDEKTLGNLFLYQPATKKWCEPENCGSVSRVWHTSTFVPSLNCIVTFGGEREIDASLETLDDIMVLDTALMLWYPPTVTGKSPTPRAGHSAALLQNSWSSPELVVFGGTRGRKWESSLHVLDCDRWEWTRPKIMEGKPPAARSYHSATAIRGGTAMVIFGGNDGDNCFNDVAVLTPMEGGGWSWTRPMIVGELPRPRTGHAACLLEDGKSLLVHGGWDPSDEVEYFNDCFVLNTESWEWSGVPSGLIDTQRTSNEIKGITGHTMEYACEDTGSPKSWNVALFGGQSSNGARVNSMDLVSF